MENKRKLYGFILGILMFAAIVVSFSYAYYAWKSDEDEVSFSISDSYFYCESGIESQVSGLTPISDYKSGYYQTFMVNNIGKSDTTFSVSLNISEIDDSLLSSDLRYKLVRLQVNSSEDDESNICASTNDTGCEEVASGDFSNFKVGMNTLVESISLNNNLRYKYYLFIWIYGDTPNDTEMQGKSMQFTLDVCEIVVFLDDNNGGKSGLEFIKVSSTYAGLPTLEKDPLVINYNTNGGTSVSSSTITFKFDGWYLDDNNITEANKVSATTSVVKPTNHTLYANWIPTPSTGATLSSSSKTGYTFNGWYKEGTYVGKEGTNYLPDYENGLTEITLDANFTANKYTVNFECNGATTCPSSISATYDETVTISNASKKITVTGDANGTGASVGGNTSGTQTFSGWTSSTSDGLNTNTAKYGTTTTPTTAWTGSLTKYVYYKNLTPTNSGIVKLTANWTETSISLPKVTKDGYTCGWNTNSSGTTIQYASEGTYKPSTAVDGNETQKLYAVCLPNTATVTITKDGSAWSNSGMNVALYGTSATYTYSAGSASGSTVKWTSSGTGVTITAGTYNIYASESSNNKTTLKDTGVDIVIKTGTTSAGSGSATINYSESTGTFKYYNNQSTSLSCQSLETINSCSVTAPGELGTPTGYTFRGWSTATSATATTSLAATDSATLTADATYYASYEADVTITIYYSALSNTDYTWTTTASTNTALNGTKYMNYTGTTIEGEFNNEDIPTAVTSSTGGAGAENYIGLSSSASSVTLVDKITTATTTYYAVYTENLTFYYYNGSSHTSTAMTRRMLYNGTNYTLSLSSTEPTPSAYDGASYVYWSYTSDAINQREPLKTGSGVLYAVYQKDYTITYDANGGSGGPSNQTATKSYISKSGGITELTATATIPSTTPTLANYNFTGWKDEEGNDYTAGSTYNITKDLNLTAQWELASYNFSLNLYLDGSIYSSTSISAGLKIDGVDQGYINTYSTKHLVGTTWEVYGVKINGTLVEYTSSGTINLSDTTHNINFYTVTFSVNNTSYGTIDTSSLYVLSGTTYSISGNILTLSDGRKVTATATSLTCYSTTMANPGWTDSNSNTLTSGTITAKLSITANFTRSIINYTATFSVNNSSYGSVSPTSASIPCGSTYIASGQTLTFTKPDSTTAAITASTAIVTNYVSSFNNWTTSGGTVSSTTAATISSATTITANFSVEVANYSVNTSPTTYYVTLANAIAGAASGNTITLLRNYTDTSTATFNKNATLNVGTYTLTRNTAISVPSGYTLTLAGSGTIINSGTSNLIVVYGGLSVPSTFKGTLSTSGDYRSISSAGVVTVAGGTITSSYYAISASGSTTISGGVIKSSGTAGYALVNSGTGSATISGGSLGSAGHTVHNSGTLSVSGGTVNNTAGYYAIANSGGATISGGSINSTSSRAIHNNGGKVTIKGGIVTSSGTAGYALVNNSTTSSATITGGTLKSTSIYALYNAGTATVNGASALISSGSYHTVYNGGVYVQSAGTVGSSATTNSYYGVYNAKSATITGGNVLSYSSYAFVNGATASTASLGGTGIKSQTAYSVYNNGSATISGASIRSASTHTLYNSSTGTLTISSGTIGSSASATAYAYYAINNAGKITMNGGVVASYSNYSLNNSGTVTITAGTLSTYSARVINNSGNTDISGGLVSTSTSYGMVNTGTASISGGTIISNGYFTVYNTGTFTTSGGNVLSTSESSAVVNLGTANLNKGTINNSSSATNTYAVYNGYATTTTAVVNVGGATITGTNNGGAVYNLYGTFKMTSGSLYNAGNAAISNNNSAVVTITGGNINGTGGSSIYHNGTATVSISGGSINGANITLNNNKTGTVTITGGIFTGGSTATEGSVIRNDTTGYISITSATISTTYSRCIYNYSTGTIDIKTSNITGQTNNAVDRSAIVNGEDKCPKSVMTIRDSVVKATKYYAIRNMGGDLRIYGSSTVDSSGGNYSAIRNDGTRSVATVSGEVMTWARTYVARGYIKGGNHGIYTTAGHRSVSIGWESDTLCQSLTACKSDGTYIGPAVLSSSSTGYGVYMSSGGSAYLANGIMYGQTKGSNKVPEPNRSGHTIGSNSTANSQGYYYYRLKAS